MADRTRPCSIDGCDRLTGLPGTAREMCHRHYRRWQRYGDPLVTRRRRNACQVDDCGLLVKSNGWCSKHYTRWVRYGSPTHRLPGEVVNGYRICPRCGEDKSLLEWGTNRRTKTGLSAYCKACMRAIQKAYKARPEYVRSPRDAEKDREYTQRWRAANPDIVRSYCATRRALRQTATVETFTVAEIFERDRWICHICNEAIDPDLRYPHPMSVSLDHVVPLSRGGAHSRANVAATHLTCNISKKDRTGVGRGATNGGGSPYG